MASKNSQWPIIFLLLFVSMSLLAKPSDESLVDLLKLYRELCFDKNIPDTKLSDFYLPEIS